MEEAERNASNTLLTIMSLVLSSKGGMNELADLTERYGWDGMVGVLLEVFWME